MKAAVADDDEGNIPASDGEGGGNGAREGVKHEIEEGGGEERGGFAQPCGDILGRERIVVEETKDRKRGERRSLGEWR